MFSLDEVFPMHPENGSGWQAGVQMAGIVVTLLFAIVGGTITGKNHPQAKIFRALVNFWF